MGRSNGGRGHFTGPVRTGDAVSLVLQQLGQDGRTMVLSKPVSIRDRAGGR